ncbi:MAG TPA: hypothetical protein VG273_11530 [Bryobacteraceae bacterium]|jgi:predicted DNA binding CopG/RHH family protein|nr:hypothetical protein [Bryobacteraceae bacterium]
MALKKDEMNIPEFTSEAQEAQWWDEHRGKIESRLLGAMRSGTVQRNAATRLAGEARASRNITIRMPLADLERARQLSARRGLAYQTFIKMLLHEALDSEEKRLRV